MGLVSRLFRSLEDPKVPISSEKLAEILDVAQETTSGKKIGVISSLHNTAVYACVRIIAETIATLPLLTYQRVAGGKQRAPEHPLYSVLHDQPNSLMSPTEFNETYYGHLNLWGNAYAQIVDDGRGGVSELWPLRPDRMNIYKTSQLFEILGLDDNISDLPGKYLYVYTPTYGATPIMFQEDEIFHTRLFSIDGVLGMSPIGLARNAIGLAVSAEDYGARFFKNDSSPRGVLQVAKRLNSEGLERLRASYEALHTGSNQHRVAILEEGTTWQAVGMPPADAQFIETRKYGVIEMARIFRVPPHKLAELDRSTFNNIEHQSIEFVVDTIRPQVVRFEQKANMRLLRQQDRQKYFVQFLIDGLLRGDLKTRYSAYQIGRNGGWLSADDIRELENMNPIADGWGKGYWMPLNMQLLGGNQLPTPPAKQQPAVTPKDQPAQQGGDGLGSGTGDGETNSKAVRKLVELIQRRSPGADNRRKLGSSFTTSIRDALDRIVAREKADVMREAERLAKRQHSPFLDWLERFYSDHPEFIRKTILPTLQSYGDVIQRDAADEIAVETSDGELGDFIDEYATAFALEWAGSSFGQLRQVYQDAEFKGDDPINALQSRFDEWKDQRNEWMASLIVTEAANAVTRETWRRYNVVRISWVASGRNCPYCTHLDGKVVGIEKAFVDEGEELQPEGADSALTPSRNIKHPPVHRGCDCGIAPA